MKSVRPATIIPLMLILTMHAVSQQTPNSEHKQGCESSVRSTLERLYAAWSNFDPVKAAAFYDKNPNLIFFDVAPLKYTGWPQYAAGVPLAFAPYKSAVFQLKDDIQVHCHGDLAWAAATWHGDLTKRDGGKDSMDGRYTAVLGRHGDEWLIEHEHMSLPAPQPKQ